MSPTSSTTDYYDPNYEDYTNRDYPNLDYYDDSRQAKSFDNDYNSPSNNDAHNHHDDDFMIKQLQSTIPGVPGVDYALYQSVPDTSFQCRRQKSPGFYGDVEAQCQVFHICQEDDRQDSFLCPIGTVFNQLSFVCDWWFNFRCDETPTHYHLNHQFHSSSGMIAMRDTMKKMRNVRHNINTNMNLNEMKRKINIGLKRIPKTSVRNIQDEDTYDNLPVSKVKNLFMLGMRAKRLKHSKNKEILGDVTTSTLPIGMKSVKLVHVSHVEDSEDNITTSTLPFSRTPDEAEIMKTLTSTGFLDSSVSKYQTKTNSNDVNNNISTSYVANDVTDSLFSTTKKIRGNSLYSLVTSMQSHSNLLNMENIVNANMTTTGNLNQVGVQEMETSTSGQYLKITMKLSNNTVEGIFESKEQVNTTVKEIVRGKSSINSTIERVLGENDLVNNGMENVIKTGDKARVGNHHMNSHSIYSDSGIKMVDLNPDKKFSTKYKNLTITDILQSSENPGTISSPFNHQNNFVIGNDTHISVSVTIHSKAGRSRLQWKRLPGIKRIRKIRVKNSEEDSNLRENTINETNFRKRMFGSKPKSRVMWIPAKRNTLDRRQDWNSFAQPRTYEATAEINLRPVEHFLHNAAVETHVVSPINIATYNHVSPANVETRYKMKSPVNISTHSNNSRINVVSHDAIKEIGIATPSFALPLSAVIPNKDSPNNIVTNKTANSADIAIHDIVPKLKNIKASFIEKKKVPSDDIIHLYSIKFLRNKGTFAINSSTAYAPEALKSDFSVLNVTELSFEKNGGENISKTNLLSERKGQRYQNENTETDRNCKTICIKLLRSLNRNTAIKNHKSTKLPNHSQSLTVFDYDSIGSNITPEFGRKSVLGVSPSEQWTVKYDPGPNCDENTDDYKVLVKGWSIIIDAGSVTKEKTVKKRGCANSPNDGQIVVMSSFNPLSSSKDDNVDLNMKTFQDRRHSKPNRESMDQKYWLNLVRNWLDSSPSGKMQERIKIKGYNVRPLSDSDISNPRNKRHRSNDDSFHKSTDSLDVSAMDNHSIKPTSRNTEVRRIQNKNPEYLVDLQTERSDWFQATQGTNGGRHNKASFSEGLTDDNSDFSDSDEEYDLPGSQMLRSFKDYLSSYTSNARNNEHFNSQESRSSNQRQGSVFLSDQDDDRSYNEQYSSDDLSESPRDYDRNSQSNRQDWADEQSDKGMLPSKTSSGDWDSYSKGKAEIPQNQNQNGFDRSVKPKGRSWSKADVNPNDWSSGVSGNRPNQGSRRKDETLWQQGQRRLDITDDFSKNNRNGKDRSLHKGSSGDMRSSWPNSMNDNRGRSLSGGWNWASDEDSNVDTTSTRNNRDWSTQGRRDSSNVDNDKGGRSDFKSTGRQNWNSMKPPNSDRLPNKKIPIVDDDWFSPEPKKESKISSTRPKGDQYPTSGKKVGNKGRTSDETNRRIGGSDAQWKSENKKRNDDWASDSSNKGSSRSNDEWLPGDESDWNSEEEQKYMPRRKGWDSEYPRKNRGESSDNRRDRSSSSSRDRRGGNSRSRHVQNKGSKSQTRPPTNEPGWNQDTKSDNGWSKSSEKDRNSHSRHSNSGQKNKNDNWNSDSNFKGSSISMTSPKSWSSNTRKDWVDDEKAWNDDSNINNRRLKGISENLPKPKMDVPQWKSDDSQEWPPGSNKRQDRSDESRWDSSEDSFDGPLTSGNDWNLKGKMESKPPSKSNNSPNPTEFSKGSRTRGMRRTTGGWNKGFSGNETSSSRKGPSNENSKGANRDSIKPKMKDTDSWQASKGEDRRNVGPKANPPNKGDTKNMPKTAWKNDTKVPKNSSNSKGDSEMKKIVWSLQISDDGKLGNGWVPITIRPNLKKNGTRTDKNDKGSASIGGDWPPKEEGKSSVDKNWSEDEDWPSEDAIWPSKDEDKPLKNEDEAWEDDDKTSKDEDKTWKDEDKTWKDKDKTWKDEDNISKKEDWPSKDQDWPSEDQDWPAKDEDWSKDWPPNAGKGEEVKAKLSKYSEDTGAHQINIGINTNNFTSHLPEATFSRLFFIPAHNQRYKRDYNSYSSRSRSKSSQFRNSDNKSYKIIKTGEILNDASNDYNNNFFLAKADIMVEDDRLLSRNDNLIHFRLKNLLDQDSSQSQYQTFQPSKNEPITINQRMKNQNSANKVIRNWFTLPKESVVHEKWSSPFYSSNFSTSGWIPVNTFPTSNGRSNGSLNSSIFGRSNTFRNSIRNHSKGDPLNRRLDSNSELFDYLMPRNQSQDIITHSTLKDFGITYRDKSPNISLNEVTTPINAADGTEMKVGNKTLRIISFSDIMKQFQTNESPHNLESSKISWNVPITAAPKIYSLKLVDLSAKNNENISNSWSFMGGNRTKQAWILAENDNTRSRPNYNRDNSSNLKSNENSSSDPFPNENKRINPFKNEDTGSIPISNEHAGSNPFPNDSISSNLFLNKNNTTYPSVNLGQIELKLIGNNKTAETVSDRRYSNLNLNPAEDDGSSLKSGFRLKFGNWDEQSNWKPVLTAIGRVVPFNRTQLLMKNSTV